MNLSSIVIFFILLLFSFHFFLGGFPYCILSLAIALLTIVINIVVNHYSVSSFRLNSNTNNNTTKNNDKKHMIKRNNTFKNIMASFTTTTTTTSSNTLLATSSSSTASSSSSSSKQQGQQEQQNQELAQNAKIWNRFADNYAKSPIQDEASYQTKLSMTREYFTTTTTTNNNNDKTPASNVLEFGCGTGGTAILHAPYVKSYHAIDISDRMIEIAKERRMEAIRNKNNNNNNNNSKDGNDGNDDNDNNMNYDNLTFECTSIDALLSKMKNNQNNNENNENNIAASSSSSSSFDSPVSSPSPPLYYYDVILGMSILHLVPNKEETIRHVHDMLRPGGYFISSTICIKDSFAKYIGWITPIGHWLGVTPSIDIFSKEELQKSMEDAGFEIVREFQPAKDKAVFFVAQKKEQKKK